MKFWDIVDKVRTFCEKDAFETDEIIQAVQRIDADSNGKITYRELILELGSTVSSEDRSLKWTTKLVALAGAIAVGVFVYLHG